MKDIFIDANIAKYFANPLDIEYKKLIIWLIKCDNQKLQNNAFLVICNKLLVEYGRMSSNSNSPTNIWAIVDRMTRQGRTNHIKNEQIKEFKRIHFKKHIVKRMRCNNEDRDYIPIVLLSNRKYALVRDVNFKRDLENFPGFIVRVERRPQDLPYKNQD